MFKKLLLIAVVLFNFISVALADEGMWIPSLIGKNYNDMQRAGLRLSAQDVYDINHSSLKDAVVSLGGFCTAELVSNEGLLFTNHHCAFNAIQSQSTTGTNYLENGFWALDKKQELTTTAYAAILDHITDITSSVLPAVAGKNEQDRRMIVKKITDSLSKAEKKEKYQMVTVAEFFNGNQYFLFVYDKYTDVRLVGAPAESVGKFGGDTDNWMWPRHTGDFSIMRIYAGADNKPAAHSGDNKPYTPKKFLPISLKGVQNNDYAMIMGFPGRTQRYEFSREIDVVQNVANPIWIKYWKMMTETMKSDMDASPAVDLQLAAVYAQKMNYYKYSIGQTAQLKRLRTVENLRSKEAVMKQWIAADASRKELYGSLYENVDKVYDGLKVYDAHKSVIRYGFTRDQLVSYLIGVYMSTWDAAGKAETKPEELKKAVEMFAEGADEFYKDFNLATEKKILSQLLVMMHNDIPVDQQSAEFKAIFAKSKDLKATADKYVATLIKKSKLTNEASFKAFLAALDSKQVRNEPMFKLIDMIYGHYRRTVVSTTTQLSNQLISLKRDFAKAMLEMNPSKAFYPDANSTLRLTYGNVKEYDGLDAVRFRHYTTAEGILEKEDNTNPEFKVPQEEHNLLMAKDYGRYADPKTGTLQVCFLTTNDITGGNSGSPVINADGEQIGIAFDGNWEAMSGDIDFSGDQKRTICVDIRYVLWCIEKLGHANNLINELVIHQ